MLQNLFKDPKAIGLIFGSVIVLALVRNFETVLFYDPFLNYFKRDYLDLPFPDFNGIQLFWNILLRYFINTFFSIVILYALFQDLSIIKFTTVLYSLFFVFLISGFFFVVLVLNENSNFLLFYLRRFLIQPLFLILFIPAFYFHKKAG